MPDSALALVTCGPAYEPIDSVRRITNISSGELGVYLCDALASAGFRVLCFRGEMATYPLPAHFESRAFSTNESLAALFQSLQETPAVIFHAAALCDYTVAGVSGVQLTQKIRSDAAELQVTLRPAAKVLPELVRWFPSATVVGWKYELDGSSDDAIARGRRQIQSVGSQACVVNGSAYGKGFGLLEADHDKVTHYPDKDALTLALAQWALRRLKG